MVVTLFCAIVGMEGNAFSIDIDASKPVDQLKKAIRNEKPQTITGDADKLELFLGKKGNEWLTKEGVAAVTVDEHGHPVGFDHMDPLTWIKNPKNYGNNFEPNEGEIHVLVVVPTYGLPSQIALPVTTALNEPDRFSEECISFAKWADGAVHKIPYIWAFMSSLGGCTTNGEIFWRMEDKKVVSLLVDGWFQPSHMLANMKCILMGSPGIGKSTLLCVMAFYLVFKHHKKVLVYRRLIKSEQENCLLYLAYEDSKVVYFTMQRCKPQTAIRLYEELISQQGISNVWLLLDGFHYKSIPEGIQTFKMLATSQQVHLKSQEREDAYCCLLPCWSKKDIYLMGGLIYNFGTDVMEDRYYYSGGSVRDFIRHDIKLIEAKMAFAITQVTQPASLLSSQSNITSGEVQVDRLRRTFIKNAMDVTHFLNPSHWQQIVDSEYVVRELSLRLPIDTLALIYQWARATGHGSLAGCAFEIYIHRLAADNRLKLYTSEYDPPEFRNPNKDRSIEFKQKLLQAGSAVQWGTSSGYKPYLEEWRDNDMLTYWFPACDNFPNIDSIVKLKPTSFDEKGGMAYLQITVAKNHDISSDQMAEMNTIFAKTKPPPIFIAICPDQKSCQEFVLNSRPEVLLARQTCRVFVGYFVKDEFAIAADGPKNNISVKPVPPPHTHFTRSKRQREL